MDQETVALLELISNTQVEILDLLKSQQISTTIYSLLPAVLVGIFVLLANYLSQRMISARDLSKERRLIKREQEEERRKLHREKLESALSNANSLEGWLNQIASIAISIRFDVRGKPFEYMLDKTNTFYANLFHVGDQYISDLITLLGIHTDIQSGPVLRFQESFYDFKRSIIQYIQPDTDGNMDDSPISNDVVLAECGSIINFLREEIRRDIQ